jgi:hypothetical protein
MAPKHPHADAVYRVVPQMDGAFGVEVAIADTSPTVVTSFATEEEAEAWIVEHRRQIESARLHPRRWMRPRPRAGS